ncbi:hypothetical protein KC366_g66 [Hortaea werneckii]|nr:hypothetical protein KC366_g66 [Hortaea werneckii]
MPRQAEVAIPPVDHYHVISEIFPLNLQLLHYHDVAAENVEHGWEGTCCVPWLIAERVTDAVDVPAMVSC